MSMFAANNPMFAQMLFQEPIPMQMYYQDESDSFDSAFPSMHRRSSTAEVNPFEDSFTSFLNAPSITTPSPTVSPPFMSTVSPPSMSTVSPPSTVSARSSKSSSSSSGGRSNPERNETLLRNRRAAAKCRQRKKEWLNDLSRSVQQTEYENARLESQVSDLKEEIINIRMILASHHCPLEYLNL